VFVCRVTVVIAAIGFVVVTAVLFVYMRFVVTGIFANNYSSRYFSKTHFRNTALRLNLFVPNKLRILTRIQSYVFQ